MLLKQTVKYVNKDGKESAEVLQGVLVGRMTADVELKKVSVKGEEKAVANGSIAINLNKDTAEFVRTTFWENNAENAAKYLKKGDLVVLVGTMGLDKYTDSTGAPRSQSTISVRSWEKIWTTKKETNADNAEKAPEVQEAKAEDQAMFGF